MAAAVNNSPLIDLTEAHAIQAEQDAVFNAARDTGFTLTNAMMTELTDLKTQYGKDAVLDGLKACVDAPRIAYLRKVLENKAAGRGKAIAAPQRSQAAPAKPTVPAQRYSQREYTDDQLDEDARLNFQNMVNSYNANHPEDPVIIHDPGKGAK